MGGIGGIHDGSVLGVLGEVDYATGFEIVWQRYCDEKEELPKFALC